MLTSSSRALPCVYWSHMNLSNIADKTPFSAESSNIFLISSWKYMLWYSLDAPRRGASNEYPQHMFLWRNKKTYYMYASTPPFWSWAMTECKLWEWLSDWVMWQFFCVFLMFSLELSGWYCSFKMNEFTSKGIVWHWNIHLPSYWGATFNPL